MKETRPHWLIKVHAAQRLFMWHYMNKSLNLVLVTEYPKSGGTWFSQLLSSALEIPFPRNKRPKFETCLMHGHILYHSNFNKTIGVIRDGRDVIVSAYYHQLFNNNRNSAKLVEEHRSKLQFEDYEDIRSNLPRYIKYLFEERTKIGSHFSWSDFVNSLTGNKDMHIVKYEDLLISTIPSLQSSIAFLDRDPVDINRLKELEEKYSFKNQSSRKPGEEDKSSFLRKGISGDWKNNFSAEACEVFDKYGGEQLVELGYEKDRKWF